MGESPNQTTEHFVCPWCQYDLFGLACEKDIVRCPECGNRVNTQLLRVSAEERLSKTRGMETLPAVCSALFWMSAYLGMLFIRISWRELLVIPAALAVMWACALGLYIWRYKLVVGAKQVLLLFHICAPFLVAGALMSGCGCLLLPRSLATAGLPETISMLAAGSGGLLLGVWLYRQARHLLKNMQAQLRARTGIENK